jgi:hypothetical protein
VIALVAAVAISFASGLACGFVAGVGLAWFIWPHNEEPSAPPPAFDLDDPKQRARFEAWLNGMEDRRRRDLDNRRL